MINNEWLLLAAFAAIILVLFALDLGVFHRKSHKITIREALIWSGIWLAVAFGFNILVYFWMGSEAAIEFMAGYLVERTLSFDNLFVFLLIFSYFKVPALYQYKVLFWGIIAALVLRGVFIIAGIELIYRFHWIIYLFGAFLLVSGLKIAMRKDEEPMDVERNPVLRFCRRFLPTTDQYDDGSFFLKINGKLFATPLFIVLLVIETSDIIFAFDSVPAILGITLDPFIVYTSNIFSILGLRALYFALAGCMVMFHYLNQGITLILVFVGAKMLLSGFYEIPAVIALGFILLVIAASIGLSLLLPDGWARDGRSQSNMK
ncbi:MAG: Integral membrane protein TerC family protein [Methanosaeta sp. PtaU1.Bin060]|nr:MAG: Integral membrane protein TerC family protein [Methanosaeta sp. PtaU1.Bin060]